MTTDIDLAMARAVARGKGQHAWLDALVGEGLHPTDEWRRYGSVTAGRIEQFLGRLYAAGYEIVSYVTAPQRTPRWHLARWEGPDAAAERHAALVLGTALGWRIVPASIDTLIHELCERGLGRADDLIEVPDLVETVKALVADRVGSGGIEFVELACLVLGDRR